MIYNTETEISDAYRFKLLNDSFYQPQKTQKLLFKEFNTLKIVKFTEEENQRFSKI